MYQLPWGSAPFTADGDRMLTSGGQPVYLLGNVRGALRELFSWRRDDEEGDGVLVGISSRTDEPDWARELLSKFRVAVDDDDDGGVANVPMEDVFNGPMEIAKDSKTRHFERISKKSGVALEDMVFFDNEYYNCGQIAKMGVTVAYSPHGVTEEVWRDAMNAFPRTDGTVVE